MQNLIRTLDAREQEIDNLQSVVNDLRHQRGMQSAELMRQSAQIEEHKEQILLLDDRLKVQLYSHVLQLQSDSPEFKTCSGGM